MSIRCFRGEYLISVDFLSIFGDNKMKTQKSHLERQIQHSVELGRCKSKKKYYKEHRKYEMIGWLIIGGWALFTGVCYAMS